MSLFSSIKSRGHGLLRWSERYTKTDMVYLTSGGFWLGLSQAAQMVFGLILLVAFANLLPKESFGTYQFIISAAAILSLFTLTGLGVAVMRAAAQGNAGALRYALRVQIPWSIGIVLASGAASAYYYLQGNTTLGLSFLIIGAFQPFISGFGLYREYLLGKRAFREQSIREIGRRAIPLITLLSVLLATDQIIIIIFTYFASHTFSLALAYYLTVRAHPANPVPDPTLTSYGKHVSVMAMAAKIAEHMDKILIWNFLGAAPVAAYVLAQIPISHVRGGTQLIHTLVYPKFTQKTLSELSESVPTKMRQYFLFVTAITITYILAAPWLFETLFPAYSESVLYSQLLALALLLLPRSLIVQVFSAHAMKRELYTLTASIPFVRIVLLLVLLPLYGVMGVIVAFLISELVAAILQQYLFQKVRRRHALGVDQI